MSAMVEEERVAAEVGKLRGVLHRGRRVDDLRISRCLADGAVPAEIGAGLLASAAGAVEIDAAAATANNIGGK